jgi:hypothetical protein
MVAGVPAAARGTFPLAAGGLVVDLDARVAWWSRPWPSGSGSS